MAWVLVYGKHLHDLRLQLVQRNASLQSIIDKMARTASSNNFGHAPSTRRYLMESLTAKKARTDRSNNPFSVCIFDIDRFELRSSKHGSLAGERALKIFHNVYAENCGPWMPQIRADSNDSFGPFGAEEYIVMLPQTGLTRRRTLCRANCEAIRKNPFDDAYRQTVSGGVAEYKRGETIPELLARADEALRNAKAGRG